MSKFDKPTAKEMATAQRQWMTYGKLPPQLRMAVDDVRRRMATMGLPPFESHDYTGGCQG